MIFRSIKNLISSKDLNAQLKTFSIMKLEGGLIFYHTAIQTGLLKILAKPSTLDELAIELKIINKQLLSPLLDLGCSIGEISCRNGKYSLRGSMARALAGNLPLAELIRETVQFHADIARRLDTYLLQNTKGDYLKEFGGIIAESSRILEPFIKAFIYHTVKKSDTLSILELGCGAGEYLKYYVDINRNNTGVAIDIDDSAVEVARKKIAENNIGENFSVVRDNMLKAETLKNQKFDLVTSYSNMHYFSEDERRMLFASIHKILKDNGRFMLATGFKSKNLSSSYYNLIFSATEGLYPLPEFNDVLSDLKTSGFSRLKAVNLFGNSFRGIVAFK
jgi:SAM-dependent methyltransferase